MLVRLSDENEVAPGEWFLEHGFGRLDGPDNPTLTDLDAAQTWISHRMAATTCPREQVKGRLAVSYFSGSDIGWASPPAPCIRPARKVGMLVRATGAALVRGAVSAITASTSRSTRSAT